MLCHAAPYLNITRHPTTKHTANLYIPSDAEGIRSIIETVQSLTGALRGKQ